MANRFEKDGTRNEETISAKGLFGQFPDEDACYRWLEDARWHGTPVCPHCGGFENITCPPSKPHRYWHKDCRKQFTVTTKTCMHATKRPLQDWIFAIYSVLTTRKGISARQLSMELGAQNRTAWQIRRRIREACGRSDFKLSDFAEADETHIGDKEPNKQESKKLMAGCGAVGKQVVACVGQNDGKMIAKEVENGDCAALIPFVEGTEEPGTTIYRDEWNASWHVPTAFNRFAQESAKPSSCEYVRGDVHTNSVESVWTALKRSIYGTWHHVTPKHLERHCNRTTFRLNEVVTIHRLKSFTEGIHGISLANDKVVELNGLSAYLGPVR